ncbi:MAG: sarcosine oxidase subunit alpha family protein [Proteobacteria bacterium]|nr:sarcosine oxidase subunit alpha family protein [Pseudomonadota bacterium]MDA0993648.1 sarcosine oxidase subunit alpha family protein [Pseudomonadota bacterium]
MQLDRLKTGGRIDRTRPLNFRFNGKTYSGFAGDTLASALLANDVALVSRSFKLHRPRGIVGAGAEEPNAIVQVGTGASTLPNMRATQVELYDGLEARSTKGWPNLRFDLAALNDRFSKVFGAGFYYKTFMRPKAFWKYYERFIRASAGFGIAPTEPDPDSYEHRNAHCDVLVAGGGPAGLMAALVAARSGARVIIADEQNEFGGSLLSGSESIDGKPAAEWVNAVIAELRDRGNVTVLTRSTVFGYYDHNFIAVAEHCSDHKGERAADGVRERLWRVRADQVVLAQGAFERPLVFCNNDRPGVMTASAVSTYINRYGVCPGKRAVVFTNNDSAYRTALDLNNAGIPVVVVDCRKSGAGSLGATADAAGITVLRGHIVSDVIGRHRVSGIRIARWDGDTQSTFDSTIRIDCDLLAMSGGWSPAVHLHSQSGGTNAWDETRHCFVPAESAQANVSAGACNGHWSLKACLQDGIDAGAEVAARCGLRTMPVELPVTTEGTDNPMQALWRVPASKDPDRCPKQFIDYQNDTSVADVRLAAREGYRNVEHVKRYTALGFGTDQGKLGNINGMAILAECLGKTIPEVGTTTFRPVYTPVTFGLGAGENVGELFDPIRKTAIHERHQAAGSPFEVVGQWHRPWYFPQGGEDLHAAVARECLATRNSVGMMDASTLGKIDARGPDVVEFLERIYTHDVGRMKVGRCAYGIMLREDGMLMDDGVMARLGEHQYYLTTTTGGAANVLNWLETWLQTEWPELKVYLTSLTDSFSTIAVAGPKSRDVLQNAGCSIDLGKENFSFMSVQQAVLAGFPVQLFRVSFSGELAFEINIDSAYASQMWQILMESGKEFDITPYGTETMHVLRAEKGFVIVGQDTDGSVTPVDLGMNWLLSKNKDFLGKRSLSRQDCVRDDRKQLVGLLSVDGSTVVPEGTQLIEDPGAPKPVPMCGHVTSSYFSATLGHPIAMALVSAGHRRKDETIYAYLADNLVVPVTIVSPVFYDAKGARQNV